MPVKNTVRSLCMPILRPFESGSEAYECKPSHRKILFAFGCIFTGLATLVFWFAQGQEFGYFIPVVVFGSVGLLSLLIAYAGNDRAVAKIWSSSR
jgi:hypothetical protein